MKKNIWRILFWGLILIMCLTLGMVGYLESKRISDESEILLNKIKSILDDSYIIQRYEDSNIVIETKVKGEKLTITFSSAKENEYTYTLDNDILKTEYNKNDTTAKDILMAVTDSIAVLNGEKSNETFSIFQNSQIDNYTLDEGIEIIYNLNTTKVSLNTKVAVKPLIIENEITYFLYEDFTEEDKENYNLIKTKNNLIFIRETETEFAIAELNNITEDTIESLKNITIYFYGTEYSNKLENVDFKNKTNYSDELIEITFNPEKNEYETNNIPNDYEFIKVKINIE